MPASFPGPAGGEMWDPTTRSPWSADLAVEPPLDPGLKIRLGNVIERLGSRLQLQPSTPIPPMFGDGAYIEVYAPTGGADAPKDLVQGLVEALEAIGKREWWHMRFWSTDQVGSAVATYIAFQPDPTTAAGFIASGLDDYQSSDIGRSTGARWSAGEMQPLPIVTRSGPDPAPGQFAIRYGPGLTAYSSEYVTEEQVLDIFGGVGLAHLGFEHYPHWDAGGKGGGSLEPVTIELVIGAALTTYALSIVSAMGTDTWVGLKKAVGRVRRHRSDAMSSATLRVAIGFGNKQWFVIRTDGRNLDEEVLARLEEVELPRLPDSGFELVIRWDSDSNEWQVNFGETWSHS
jgi:hypothetical protein